MKAAERLDNPSYQGHSPGDHRFHGCRLYVAELGNDRGSPRSPVGQAHLIPRESEMNYEFRVQYEKNQCVYRVAKIQVSPTTGRRTTIAHRGRFHVTWVSPRDSNRRSALAAARELAAEWKAEWTAARAAVEVK